MKKTRSKAALLSLFVLAVFVVQASSLQWFSCDIIGDCGAQPQQGCWAEWVEVLPGCYLACWIGGTYEEYLCRAPR
jgi:hypothetical protein